MGTNQSVAIGEILRAARQEAGLSLADMASRTHFGKGYLGNVETGTRAATPKVIAAYEHALGDLVNRRQFLSVASMTAAHSSLAAEVFSTIADKDPNPLATVQTTHATDLLIAQHVDPSGRTRLVRWMEDGDSSVLRVNSAGILAKIPRQETAGTVASVLERDGEVRSLYLTAVAARVGGLTWEQASALIAEPLIAPVSGLRAFASRLAKETLNARDGGARWCAAMLLRDLSPRLTTA